MKSISLLFLLLTAAISLQSQENPLETIITRQKKDFGAWAQNPQQYELQVIYTQIDRDAEGKPTFTSYTFGIEADRYFYPASTVKMPVAILALEKLNELGIVGLDKWTPLKTGAARSPQTPVVTDTTAEQSLPSIAHYIRKIFLVSDNDAYNRLYEFLGQGYINRKLQQKTYVDTRLIHRLSAPGFDVEENRHTNPVTFYRYDTTLYYQGPVYSRAAHELSLQNELRGKGFKNGAGEIIMEPFDFTQKNYCSLQDLHDILQAVIFPNAVPPARRFNLTTSDHAFLQQAMCELPRASRYPDYSDKADNYVKFWMYGDQKEDTDIPKHIRICNKVGWAYGFLTDVAYIRDQKNGIEFMLAGSIHVNDNQIYNDGQYEYEEVGLPFFGELGRAIYAWEQKRRGK
ncbi:serine hydrolase [Flavilitoribacter nigricans]|uniref:beta-lactamase n=1 Tax=Flavilitoribacter nigricans (strain ATCC 23147 / DSM 23189 / NBRC 102662 / NCIMB 1420 / SS-2) TaxID=1122177 RepID=A0A2D0N641_FLAN2|nr:serine hydrolase [Flavilitoribacter nigricans]PHN03629.1 hypothetical protein CRP01_25560 [Flavilitoribacter nigricans DSM 23189 = NBRC 102662]